MLPDLRTIDRDNIPPEAIDEFRDGDDLETSLWGDGEAAEHRREVFLSLILAKRSIGPLAVAMLWQDDENIGDDLGGRIVQSEGFTPYVDGRRLHYHVSNPTLQDAPRLVMAAAGRDDMPTLTREAAFNLIEDAKFENKLVTAGLDPTMQREVEKIVKQRFVDAEALRGESHERVFDVRGAGVTQKIVGATVIAEAEIAALLHRSRIGKEDVITLYCVDGVESKRIARTLRVAGKKPRVLLGGFTEWTERGFEIEAC